jgi:hypothetical protein
MKSMWNFISATCNLSKIWLAAMWSKWVFWKIAATAITCTAVP